MLQHQPAINFSVKKMINLSGIGLASPLRSILPENDIHMDMWSKGKHKRASTIELRWNKWFVVCYSGMCLVCVCVMFCGKYRYLNLNVTDGMNFPLFHSIKLNLTCTNRPASSWLFQIPCRMGTSLSTIAGMIRQYTAIYHTTQHTYRAATTEQVF